LEAANETEPQLEAEPEPEPELEPEPAEPAGVVVEEADSAQVVVEHVEEQAEAVRIAAQEQADTARVAAAAVDTKAPVPKPLVPEPEPAETEVEPTETDAALNPEATTVGPESTEAGPNMPPVSPTGTLRTSTEKDDEADDGAGLTRVDDAISIASAALKSVFKLYDELSVSARAGRATPSSASQVESLRNLGEFLDGVSGRIDATRGPPQGVPKVGLGPQAPSATSENVSSMMLASSVASSVDGSIAPNNESVQALLETYSDAIFQLVSKKLEG
jgi:hypothetical protein